MHSGRPEPQQRVDGLDPPTTTTVAHHLVVGETQVDVGVQLAELATGVAVAEVRPQPLRKRVSDPTVSSSPTNCMHLAVIWRTLALARFIALADGHAWR